MAHGGARTGSGRKKGQATKLNEEARRKAAEGGELPLDFLLATMRDAANEFGVRLDAAKAAAPYVHAKLAAVDMNHSGQVDATISFQTVYEGGK